MIIGNVRSRSRQDWDLYYSWYSESIEFSLLQVKIILYREGKVVVFFLLKREREKEREGMKKGGRERAKEISPKMVGHMPELAISSRADRWHTDPGHISESQFQDFRQWLTMNGPRSTLKMPLSKCFLSPSSYRLA